MWTGSVSISRPYISWATGCGLVSDIDQSLADVVEMNELLHNTTKPILAWASSMENWKDILEMFETVAGGKEKLADILSFITTANQYY